MIKIEEQLSMETTAIVLAGGKGSRMNYAEKAWMLHHGKPLLSHVVDSIHPQVDGILISRNNINDPRYDSLPFSCISDIDFATDAYDGVTPEQKGPLSGISACARQIKTSLTLVVPCDTPHLPSNLMRRLLDGLGDASVAVAHDGKSEQPLVFLAQTIALQAIVPYLKTGRRSVRGWLNEINRNRVYFEAESSAFENINTLEQLR
jgi:molybdopterin-guanine dinucleotide biosynthesis protein A